MRTLALLLAFALPCAVAVAAPVDIPSNLLASSKDASHPMRVSFFNTSGERRQVRLKDRVVELPFAKRVDLDVHLGSVVHVVSDTNRKVSEAITMVAGDDARLIPIR